MDVPVFLAFPDAGLRYDCASCDQRCCKTSGLAVFPAERQQLLRRHPALELVAPPTSGGIDVFATPPGGCWFLEGSSCGLLPDGEAVMNRRHTPLRPRACTLFPFNVFAALGDTLVVAPNALCPLRVEPGQGVTHAEVSELLARLGAAGAPPQTLRPTAQGLVPLEILVRDAATASLSEPSPVPLIAFSELATTAHAGGDLGGLALHGMNATIDDMYERLEGIAVAAAIPVPSNEDLAAVAPILAAWTPTLRLFAFESVPVELLPSCLLAVALYAAHWQALRRDRPLIPQALLQLVSSVAPTLELLARWHRPWSLGPLKGVAGDITLGNGQVPAEVLARRFGPLTADDDTAHERTLALRALADATRRRATRGNSLAD